MNAPAIREYLEQKLAQCRQTAIPTEMIDSSAQTLAALSDDDLNALALACGLASTERHCVCCGVAESATMLAYNGSELVCSECDSELENAYVEEDPDERRHSLDAFSPLGD